MIQLFLTFFVTAASANELSPTLRLEDYLRQVKSGSPEARALQANVEALKLKLVEADGMLVTEMYGEIGISDDSSEKLVPFMGSRTEGHGWKLGLRKPFSTGTSANLFYESRWANLTNAFGVPTPNYYENRATLELSQSLWRNGFGAQIRADQEALRSQSRAAFLRAKYELKNLLLNAENTYWALVTYNQVIQLQEENVDRSRKLRDLMRRKAGLRLTDDVEAIQAQASLETRELELQASQDERAELARRFNTLRGVSGDAVEKLSELPEKDLVAKRLKGGPRISREDFEALSSEAAAARSSARAGRSRLRPQFDLVGSFSANGMNSRNRGAWEEVAGHDHPSWMVGLRFSAALDFGLIGDLADSYHAQQRAAREMAASTDFNLERTYSALTLQLAEAQRRFEKSISLEKVQSTLVKRERQRLLSGRTTAFQAISFEQNLAASQIQRVRAQLTLLQLHNVLKTFDEPEERP